MYHARNNVLYQRGQTVTETRNESGPEFQFNADYRRYQLNSQEIYNSDIPTKPFAYHQPSNPQLPDYLSEASSVHRNSPISMKERPTSLEQGYMTSSLYNCKSDVLATFKDECSDLSGYSSSDTGNELEWMPTGTGRSRDRVKCNGGPSEQPYRPRKPEMLSLDDDERRKIRRERNKMAAAKCRQRRVDLTNELLSQTERLEDQKRALQKEIDSLQHQRSQLEYVLGAHTSRCRITLKTEKGSDGSSSYPHENGQDLTKTGLISNSELIQPKTNSTLGNGRNVPCYGVRPDSLKLRKPATATDAFAGSGVDLSHLGLDSMMDGHTGLTPITGQATYTSQSMDTFCDTDATPTNNMTLMNL